MSNILHVLILEDRPEDAELALYELRIAGFKPEWQRVDTEADYLACLKPGFDVILADYNLPQFNALQALQYLKDSGLDIPFIVVTGTLGDEAAVEIMRQGAADYLLKDRLARLGPAVTRALQEKKLRDEKQRAEVALRENEARLAGILDIALEAVISVDDSYRIVIFNQGARHIFGYAPEEAIGQPLDLLIPARLQAVHRNHVAGFGHSEVAARYMRSRMEIVGQRKNGEEFPAEASISQFELNGRRIFTVVLRDITERRQAEEALRESEARFRQLFEYSPVGISIVRERICLYANRALADIYGDANVLDLINVRFVDRIAPDYRAAIQEKLEGGRQTLPLSLETFGLRKDGSIFPMHLFIALIPLADSPALIIFTIDISERIRLDEETLRAETLRVELEKEKELTDLKDRFISMVTHEFRTPLTVIRMSNQLIVNYSARFSEERKLKFLQEIDAQVTYMVELLENVLAVGKAKAGKIKFNPALTDARAFSQTILEQLQLVDAEKHHFTFIAEGDLENVPLDEQLLRHILVNLLSNAIKYSPAGSTVYFEVCREANEIVLQVKDEGIGIPEADQVHLFEAFHRATNAATIQGTGLGLAIVKTNVETHGGTIAFDSQQDVGTTFTVRLPARSPVGGTS